MTKTKLQGKGCDECVLKDNCDGVCLNVRKLLLCRKCHKAIGVMCMSGALEFDESYMCFDCYKGDDK